MQTVKLYREGCTRKNRFSNYSSLSTFLNSQTPLILEMEGCVITETTGYFDFRAPYLGMYNTLVQYSYLLVDMNDGSTDGTIYFAFIEKIEPNNFNASEGNYYRCYFTIDWWSTLLPFIDFSKIEGEVERGHINDVKRLSGTNSFVPTLRYTTEELEEPLEKLFRKSYNVFPEKDARFLYVITTKSKNDFPSSTPHFRIGNKSISSSLSLGVMILPKGDFLYENTKLKLHYTLVTTDEQGNVTYEPKDYILTSSNNSPKSPDCLTDSSVIGTFVSDYCPFYTQEGEFYYNLGQITPNVEALLPNLFKIASLSGYDGATYDILPLPEDFIPINLVSTDYNIKTANSRVVIPTDYERYLENNIIKSFFAPYNIVFVNKGQNKITIDTAECDTNNLCDINMNGYGTAYIVKLYQKSLLGESAYKTLYDIGLTPPPSINDIFTKVNTYTNIAVGTSNAIAGVASAILSKGATAPNAISAVGRTVTTVSDAIRTLRDGENGTNSTPSASNNYVDVVMLSILRPSDEEMSVIIKHLALYGYTTYLHTHEILNNHKRKYFNYIKTRSCIFNSTNFNEIIRKDIENMFDSGVWLWNTHENFGNYEVPNYPILMDEVNNV